MAECSECGKNLGWLDPGLDGLCGNCALGIMIEAASKYVLTAYTVAGGCSTAWLTKYNRGLVGGDLRLGGKRVRINSLRVGSIRNSVYEAQCMQLKRVIC